MAARTPIPRGVSHPAGRYERPSARSSSRSIPNVIPTPKPLASSVSLPLLDIGLTASTSRIQGIELHKMSDEDAWLQETLIEFLRVRKLCVL